MARCHDVGIKAHLIKPVRRTDLLAAIKMVLSAAPQHERIQRAGVLAVDTAPKPARKLRILLAEDNVVEPEGGDQAAGADGSCGDPGGKRQASGGTPPHRSQFDVVLMDVQMPEMDGLEATATIRREEFGKPAHMPIIGLTAFAMKEDQDHCLAAGMDGCLSKPIRSAELIKMINALTEVASPTANDAVA